MENKKTNFISLTDMADRRKQIEQIYGGADEGLQWLYERSSSRATGARYTENRIDTLLRQVGTTTLDKREVVDLANFAYATDPNYANILDYLANMFLWRYYYFPVQARESASRSDYAAIYNLMTEVIDGLAIEVTFPAILSRLLKEGAIYLYATKNASSKTISTVMLNPTYCRPIMLSQYGTGIFQFDLKYFDDLGLSVEETAEILEFFPAEITQKYLEFKKGLGPQKVILDGRYSTYITLNDFGFANRLPVLKALFDYDTYRKNEVERNSTQLDRIITHRIPSYENRLLFELPEVRALHKSMSRSLGGSSRSKFLTTFGEVGIHPIIKENYDSSDILKKALQGIYRTAGVNADMFTGDSQDAIDFSLTKDQATIWRYVQQLVNFYNLTINNLFNFKGYQAELTILPITHYNLSKMMELHRRNGEYGIGRLEALVASGTKQKHIGPKSELEEFLKLDEILKPLQSSHTRSAKEEEEVESKPKDEDEDVSEPKKETEPNNEKNEENNSEL